MRVARMAMLWVRAAILCAAGCIETEAPPPAPEPPPFGWTHPIAPYNSADAVWKPLGSAQDAVAGHSIKDIVTTPSVRVRGDNRACVECHMWAWTVERTQFCDTFVPRFEGLPTETGNATDAPSAKPQLLKDLLADWKARGCPD